MPGTSDSWKVDKILLGAGKIYANVAIPGAGGRLTLDATTLTPDSTANPLAVHLGATKAGAKITVKTSWTDYYVDEFSAPVVTNFEQTEASLSGEFHGVTDMDLLVLMSPGSGSKVTGTGFEQVTFGKRSLVYPSIAIIAPLIEDSTKVAVFQLYKARNSTGIEMNIGRKEFSSIPFNFQGYEVTTRAATDTLCSFWKQVA